MMRGLVIYDGLPVMMVWVHLESMTALVFRNPVIGWLIV